jgi:hypothetical protein
MPLLQGEETRSADELKALRKRADEQAQIELGSAIALVEIGEVVTFGYMEKELAMMERLDAAIARDQKSLFVRARDQINVLCYQRPSAAIG